MKKGILFGLLILMGTYANAQLDVLKGKMEDLLKTKNAKVGISVISNNDSVAINANDHYPMQSVFKFPIALAVLSKIDQGKISFDQRIKITRQDLRPDTWSPIKDKYPHGTTLTVEQILEYTISQSDNIGCDILLKLIGGTPAVEQFLQTHHFSDIAVKASEAEMHKEWSVQYQNWTTPAAINHLLIAAYQNRNQMLSQKSHDFIWRVMAETTTGSKRIKGQLPPHTMVAHKTGTSGTNHGLTAATNDIGVITLPDGQLIFISILVSDSRESAETNEKIIADLSKLVWDYYLP